MRFGRQNTTSELKGVKVYSCNTLLSLYEKMLTIRLCEEGMVEPILCQDVKCPCHLYSGQEAVAVGICAHLGSQDCVFSNHRSHGHYLASGGSVECLFDEVYGRSSGCAGGRGGSMHLLSPENGMMGAAPIVAGTISLAVGAALACQIRKESTIAVTFFGDGATTEGVLMEAMNFAGLRKLPILFVCENNLYATHMPIHEIRPDVEIYQIAQPFGIRSCQVDGNDVLSVLEVAREALDECRQGRGPYFIEAMTYRLRGHVGPDDNIQGTHTDIRPLEEIESWKAKDPIPRFESYLIKEGIISESELSSIRSRLNHEVNQAKEQAILACYPNENELADNVFK